MAVMFMAEWASLQIINSKTLVEFNCWILEEIFMRLKLFMIQKNKEALLLLGCKLGLNKILKEMKILRAS